MFTNSKVSWWDFPRCDKQQLKSSLVVGFSLRVVVLLVLFMRRHG